MHIAVTEQITEFLKLYDLSVDTMKKAGRLLVEMMVADPDACEKIKAASGGRCTDATLHLFVRIGQGTLMPELLTSNCPAYRALRKMPATVQAKLIQDGMAPMLLTADAESLVRIPLTEMSAHQVSQCFNRVGVRPTDEQQAWLRRNIAPTKTMPDEKPYRITKTGIVHFSDCTLSLRQIAAILAEAS